MIELVIGKIEEINENSILVVNQGIGYCIFINNRESKNLTIHEEIKVYTSMIVREDDISLYGFLSKDERRIFKLLITVSGIGPKVAMGIMNELNQNDLRNSILTSDINKLQSAPGVGKKTAQRIILELKDKIAKINFENPLEAFIGNEDDFDVVSSDNEVVEALVSLGYNSNEAKNALRSIDANLPIEIQIREALKVIGR